MEGVLEWTAQTLDFLASQYPELKGVGDDLRRAEESPRDIFQTCLALLDGDDPPIMHELKIYAICRGDSGDESYYAGTDRADRLQRRNATKAIVDKAVTKAKKELATKQTQRPARRPNVMMTLAAVFISALVMMGVRSAHQYLTRGTISETQVFKQTDAGGAAPTPEPRVVDNRSKWIRVGQKSIQVVYPEQLEGYWTKGRTPYFIDEVDYRMQMDTLRDLVLRPENNLIPVTNHEYDAEWAGYYRDGLLVKLNDYLQRGNEISDNDIITLALLGKADFDVPTYVSNFWVRERYITPEYAIHICDIYNRVIFEALPNITIKDGKYVNGAIPLESLLLPPYIPARLEDP